MDKSTAGRLGAAVQQSRNDPNVYTRAAHEAWHAKFARQVDPDGELSEAERERRTQAAMREHMLRLAIRSAEVRKARQSRRKASRS